MKKYLILLVLVLLTGCGRDKNKLIMVTEAGFAPYEYYENGDIVGVDVEIAKEIAKSLDKELVIKDIYFDSILNEIKSGKADIALAGISVNEERKKEVDFSINYITSRQVVIVLKDSNITDVDNVYNKKVAVQLGSVADTYFTDKHKSTELVRQKKYLTMVEDLKGNKVDAIVMDELPAKEIVKKNTNLTILDGYIFEDTYGIAIKKGNTELLDKVNKVLNNLINKGKIDEYVIKYTKQVIYLESLYNFFNEIFENLYYSLIYEDRYLYILEGLGNTIIMALFATVIGVLLGTLIALIIIIIITL